MHISLRILNLLMDFKIPTHSLIPVTVSIMLIFNNDLFFPQRIAGQISGQEAAYYLVDPFILAGSKYHLSPYIIDNMS
jgi:hypothetical protein